MIPKLQEWRRLVDEEIDRFLPPDIEPEILAKASRHLIEAGGKRLRPCFALAACEAVGGRAEDAVEAAAALELLHNFTLIHDDIMDRDEFRRGTKTVHKIWGEPIAIIAGDALFAKVFKAIAANGRRIRLTGERIIELLETVSEASFEICQGQALGELLEGREDTTEEDYMMMVSKKTGALIEASVKVGALLGGGAPEHVKALAEYGRLVGIAFQIQDDVLGLVGGQEKLGKPIGSDIRGGECTLPTVWALKAASPGAKAALLRALGNEGATEAELREAIEALKREGAIDYALRKAGELIAEAKFKLDVLPDSGAKRILSELADFAVEREF